MAIFKILTFSNADNLKLLERLNYIREPEATSLDLIFGRYVSIFSPYEEMTLVKQCYMSEKNDAFRGKNFIEYIISLREKESCYLGYFMNCIKRITYWLADYKGGHYQVISAIHLNTENLHAHIIANNTDFMTGARFTLFKADFFSIREYVNAVLQDNYFSGLEKK